MTERTLLAELEWCIENGTHGPRTLKALESARDGLSARGATSEALLNMSEALVAWLKEAEKHHEITSFALSAFSDGYEAGMKGHAAALQAGKGEKS